MPGTPAFDPMVGHSDIILRSCKSRHQKSEIHLADLRVYQYFGRLPNGL